MDRPWHSDKSDRRNRHELWNILKNLTCLYWIQGLPFRTHWQRNFWFVGTSGYPTLLSSSPCKATKSPFKEPLANSQGRERKAFFGLKSVGANERLLPWHTIVRELEPQFVSRNELRLLGKRIPQNVQWITAKGRTLAETLRYSRIERRNSSAPSPTDYYPARMLFSYGGPVGISQPSYMGDEYSTLYCRDPSLTLWSESPFL
jgi:hypothetical protein